MKAAVLFHENEDGSITCTACRRYCRLRNNQIGFCGVRKNVDGVLQLLVYGRPFAVNIDPIEKKPVLHAYPGTKIYSLSTAGCDFACKFCQNYEISQRREVVGEHMEPYEIVDEAIRYGCQGIAYTYNEPTIFTEYAMDIGKEAHKHGLFNIYVTNGYETAETVDLLKEFLDFATVDFKGNASIEFYRKYILVPDSHKIFDTLELLKDTKIHTEITDLVVPEIGENLDEAAYMIQRVKEIFGDEMPISFLRFHPDYLLNYLPSTPADVLIQHYELARKMGMKYVYIGNVPGLKEQNTYCPKCGTLLIKRDNLNTQIVNLKDDSRCPKCGTKIPILMGKFKVRSLNIA
jgi:pyruvate formate lyase activating enzyme